METGARTMSKIRVYHLDWTNLRADNLLGKMVSRLQFGHGNDSLASKCVNRLFTETGEYTLVAMVKTGSLEAAYQLTNTINFPWWENIDVEPIVTETRSTSVGDLLLLDDGSIHLVRPVGFLEIAA